ncbi:hypothetical protein SEA_DARDANUS_42 [Gordonia phage Dardanus]|uniref:Uncharacterized protein n=1 Tax=Gordonia phage Dardanus TaxID=2588489 RepID=A0A514CX44_9CAUD|nr:hypothetical protein KDJ58_gp42 [Gordonia phage Dardanus]QDH85079.1 hypothetical protein SEA_DARDANUS_42 [Gordonia phage Dardanus]
MRGMKEVRAQAGRLLESGDVEAYADELAGAVAEYKGAGRDGAAKTILCNEADRWLGETYVGGEDDVTPVGLAAELEEATS